MTAPADGRPPPRSVLKTLLVVGPLLALAPAAGCGSTGDQATAPGAGGETGRPAPAMATGTGAGTGAPQAAASPVPPPARTYPPPTHLIGLNGDEVMALLGKPGFRRLDAPAAFWQYRTAACALDLFLYPAGAGDEYRVRHLETRNRGEAALSGQECFVSLLKAHETRRRG